MNNLIVACIVLTLTNISFAILAWLWRNQVKRVEHQALDLLRAIEQVGLDRYTDGLAVGTRHGIGLMYSAAVRADRMHADILASLRAVSRGMEPVEEALEAT